MVANLGKADMDNYPVLVLNLNYEPLNVCHFHRAVILLWQGKAEILENGRGLIHTASSAVPIPSVIRLVYYVKRPRPQRKLTRREIFIRDSYTCQYCGKQTRDLTLDHVVPRFLGGPHSWENLVSACGPCNRHKAGRNPVQAQMKLLHQPFRPRFSSYHLINYSFHKQEEWDKYIPEWEREHLQVSCI